MFKCCGHFSIVSRAVHAARTGIRDWKNLEL
jgi:hypothetical protein